MNGQAEDDSRALVQGIVQEAHQERDIRAALALVSAFAICDFAICPLLSSIFRDQPNALAVFCALAVYGAIGAQAGLLAIWSVLWPVSLWKRRGAECVTGLIWLSAWAVGYLAAVGLDNSLHDGRSGLWVTLFVPAVYLGVQAPLWLARGFLRWRIENDLEYSHVKTHRSLSLAEVLVAMASVGVALAAARPAFFYGVGSAHWDALGIAVLVATGISTASTVPATALVLGVRNIGQGLAFLFGYALLCLLGVVLFISIVLGPIPSLEPFFYLLSAFAGFVAALVGPLWLARALGYRLAWGREVRG